MLVFSHFIAGASRRRGSTVQAHNVDVALSGNLVGSQT
jgi:hypothetical protein